MEEKKMKKVKEKKKKELKTLDNVSSEQQSSVYVLYLSVNQIYSRKALDQKGQIETTNRLFEA